MLEARSLTKYFNHTLAVKDVSFRIRPGEILGYLGPNGGGQEHDRQDADGSDRAFRRPDPIQRSERIRRFTGFQRRIGYVPEEPHLYPHLTGREYLQLVGRLRGMPRTRLEQQDGRVSAACSASGMTAIRRWRRIPKACGRRSAVGRPAARPRSADPGRAVLRAGRHLRVGAAQAAARAGGCGKDDPIQLARLEVVEKVCSQVLILRKGEVVAYDSITRLRELMSQPSLEGVFAQLAEVEDGEVLANRILAVMRS